MADNFVNSSLVVIKNLDIYNRSIRQDVETVFDGKPIKVQGIFQPEKLSSTSY